MKKKYIIWIGIICVTAIIIAGTWWLSREVERAQMTVHYHANIAFYINDKRLDISKDKYMEDIGACKPGNKKSPRDRVHFHENNMDTVHVHDDGVTWGHLLSNLGFSFSKQTIIFDDGQVIGNDEHKNWKFVLNGQQVPNPFNLQIQSRDRLLMSYGKTTQEELQKQFENVSQNAEQYNGKYDPGMCKADEKQNVVVKAIIAWMTEKKHKNQMNH